MRVADVSLPGAKSVGMVYKLLSGIMEKYYGGRFRNFLYEDKLKADMREAGAAALKTDAMFPKAFYEEVANLIGHWYRDGFTEIRDFEITPLFSEVFQLHKAYLDKELTDENVDAFLATINKAGEKKSKYVARLYICVMRDLEEREKARQSATETAEANNEANR